MYGWASLGMWTAAFLTFFIPEAVAVLVFSRREPGEGGIYLWTRRQFGEAHGFISGWCYWTNNLFYIPVLLVYMAGIFAFASGPRSAALVDNRLFVGGIVFGWLAVIAAANVRGLAIGKWIQNVGGISTALSVGLVVAAAAAAGLAGSRPPPPAMTAWGWDRAAAFAVMCNAFVGVELASTMGDEIRDASHALPVAVYLAGGISLLSYLVATAAVLALVPAGQLGAIQGVMQAVTAGAIKAQAGWIVGPLAVLMGLSIGGTASAWFAGSSRIPFVAGLSHALPPILGRVHPRWHSPHIALLTCAALAAVFAAWSLVGSGVAEAYQVLLKSAVAIQLVPFAYLFAALLTIEGAAIPARVAGVVGLVATLGSLVAAFVPTADVQSVLIFETKMAAGVAGPIAVGWVLFRRARRIEGRAGHRHPAVRA